MQRTISISESGFNLLDQEARRSRLSPNDLADRLLARVHDRMAKFDPAEIESDITAASAQAKAERRARHGSA